MSPEGGQAATLSPGQILPNNTGLLNEDPELLVYVIGKVLLAYSVVRFLTGTPHCPC